MTFRYPGSETSASLLTMSSINRIDIATGLIVMAKKHIVQPVPRKVFYADMLKLLDDVDFNADIVELVDDDPLFAFVVYKKYPGLRPCATCDECFEDHGDHWDHLPATAAEAEMAVAVASAQLDKPVEA